MTNKEKRIPNHFNRLFMAFFPTALLITLYFHITLEGFNPWLFIPFIVLYIFTGLSITAGYHRLFSHQTYKAHPLVKIFFLIFGAAAFENSCLKWSMDHRRHHYHCDGDQDPYNINEGFWYAHMGWLLVKDKYPKLSEKFAKDLARDPLILWQSKYYVPIAISAGILLPLFIGYLMGSPLGGLAIVGFFRIVWVQHMTFFINSLCHVHGTRPYNDQNTAYDSALMSFFTYGEGYHNFHHYFQSDYRNGVKWYQFDPTKWLIKFLSFFGLTSHLKVTPNEEIIRARVKMDRKRIAASKLTSDIKAKLESFGQKIDSKLAKMLELRRELKSTGQAKKEALKQAFLESQKELNDLLTQWENLQRAS